MPRVERIPYGEPADDIRTHFKTAGERNLIVSPGDLQEAARKLPGTFSATLPEMEKGFPAGTP